MKTKLAICLIAALGLCASVVVQSAPSAAQDSEYGEGQSDPIIGGTAVAPNEYPHLVGIMFNGFVGCGGSLISSTWVLTASHCLDGETTSTVTVGLGSIDKQNFVQTLNVAMLIQNPNWTGGDFVPTNDIALIKLASPANLGHAGIGTIPLNSNEAIPTSGNKVTVAGWGDTTATPDNEVFPRFALKVEVDVLSCPAPESDSSQVCAAASGLDSCQGDSGGPLVQSTANGLRLVAVVEAGTGEGCAAPGSYGIYQRVSAHLPWIKSVSGVGPAFATCDGKIVTVVGPVGTAAADVQCGTPAAEQIDAKQGDDSVCAASNDFSIQGQDGNDRIFIEANAGSASNQFIAGDGITTAVAGDDRIVVRAGAMLDGTVAGDSQPSGDGGADTILFAGNLIGNLLGDNVTGNGGPDFIGVLPAGDVQFVVGDGADLDGGKDTITIVGNAGSVRGDGVLGKGGNDTIAITAGASVDGFVLGDNSGGDGGNDFFIIRSLIGAGVLGDDTGANGGKDFMRIYPAARINGPVIGDGGPGANGAAPGAGGNDTIVAFAGSEIDGNVFGDSSTTRGGNDRFSLGALISGSVLGDQVEGNATFAGHGGNDSIGIGGAGNVTGDLIGDGAAGNGGDDILDVSGTVVGNVFGDSADGDGGDDTIFIRAIGTTGAIVGDGVLGAGGHDIIVINKGAVVGSISGDVANGPSGDDRITVSGTVNGFIDVDDNTGLGGNDTLTINPAGIVNGSIFAGKGTNIIVVRGTVNGDIFCSPTTTLQILGGTVTGNTSSC